MTRRLWSVALLFCLSSVPPAFAAEETAIFTLSANGARNTRPFTVHDHWEIRWSNPSSVLMVTVLRSGPTNDIEALPVAVGSQLKPGEGATYIEKGGQYYLNINGMGDWTVSVVQLP